MKNAIQVYGLEKSYGSHIVLQGLDLQIETGEIFTLLGVNGAGKTTTLECIEGLRKYLRNGIRQRLISLCLTLSA